MHPECETEVVALADAVESTSGMIRFCREDDAKEYLIGTELGMIYRLEKDVPRQDASTRSAQLTVCPNMKLITLDKVLQGPPDRGAGGHRGPEDVRVKALARRAADGGGRRVSAAARTGSGPRWRAAHLPERRRAALLQLRRAGHRRRHRRAHGGGGRGPNRWHVGLITKGDLDETATFLAQGGIAAAIGDYDSPELHLKDTLEAGVGLCDERRGAGAGGRRARTRVRELERLGTKFDRRDGKLILASEGAHSVPARGARRAATPPAAWWPARWPRPSPRAAGWSCTRTSSSSTC